MAPRIEPGGPNAAREEGQLVCWMSENPAILPYGSGRGKEAPKGLLLLLGIGFRFGLLEQASSLELLYERILLFHCYLPIATCSSPM